VSTQRRRRSRFGIARRSHKASQRTGRSRVGSLISRYGLGMGIEQLEDRRMLAAGDLDTTFNPGGPIPGVVVAGFTPAEGSAVAVQSDGKILIAGTYGLAGGANFAVARLNVNGSLDTTFGAGADLDGIDGLATADFNGFQDDARGIAIDGSGRIVLVGRGQEPGPSFASGVALARFTSAGTLDTSFSGDGKALHIATNFGSFAVLSEARSVAIDGSGKYVVAGFVNNLTGTGRDFLVARFDSTTGNADATFNAIGDESVGTGMVVTHFGSAVDEAFDLAIDSAGRILVGGTGNSQFALARYSSANGALDGTFGTAGKQTTDLLNAFTTDVIHDIAIEPDGQIVAAGETFSGVGGDFAVARFDLNGTSLDTGGFNASGSQPGVFQHSVGSLDGGRGMVLQPTGAMIISGFADADSNAKAVTLRLTPAGVLDSSFATGGVKITDVGPAADRLNDVALTPDGKLVAVGTSGSSMLAIRYELAAAQADAGGPYTINEPTGSVVLNGSTTASGTITYQWDFDNDGFYDDAVGQNPTFAVSGVDGPTVFPIGLRVSIDANNDTIEDDSATATSTVTVVNVPPTLTLSGASDVNEGAVYTLNLSSSDPGADTITSWTIHWGNAIEVISGNPSSVTHTYADGDATHIISATATDEDGTYIGANTVSVNVHNVAPTLTLAGAASVNEGVVYTLNLTSSDPGLDTITSWTINWGDAIEVVGGNPSSWTHTYADGDANYNITATATDEDGAHAAGNSVAVSVLNVAPTLAITGASDVNEGASYTLNLSSFDPGADTIATWTINWGDGTEVVLGNPSSVAHTYADGDASYTISATATDEDGTFAAGNTVGVSVHNVAPTLAISGASAVNEAAVYTLNLSSSDPGADTITSWTINWGDGTQVVTGNPAGVTHTYADGTVNYTISATATDEDGTFAAGNTVAVTVNNVAPTANPGGPYATFDDTPITLHGSGTDPAGANDPLTFAWDLDNNGSFETSGANAVFDPTGFGPGTHTVKLQVSDGDGGVTVEQTTVEVLTQGTLVIDGVLHIVGTNCSDVVLISEAAGSIVVLATFNSSNPVTVSAASFTEIKVRTRGGNDIVLTSPNVTHKMTIDGGSGHDYLLGGGGRSILIGGTGNDTLSGAGGDDVLFGGDGHDDLWGGDGNDVLIGGHGNDNLLGGNGRDLLVGGQDNDDIEGGDGDDILVGGYTIHDNNVAALDSVMAIWTSSASFSSRVATLTGSGGLLQGGVAVFDDNDHDDLNGNSGRDLYFADMSTSWDGVKDTVTIQNTLDHLVTLN
jgi:uncharacterized delta-60 repeat protein